ncbi:hypothetical protein [Streptomyces sp. XY413]|uniref:hypothetical protein n=1 Tax=Streptomyces sp. XY413 TaxID=1519479 RepID=UPI0006AEC8CB|nr:hypothetical protein [Streptomyces sp. XY413]
MGVVAMLEAALAAVAVAGGTAVVQAAGTDAWNGLRSRVARLLGRGNPALEQAELERLDRTATALRELEPAEADRVRIRQEASWQTRFEVLLESVSDTHERARLAEGLRALIDEQSTHTGGGSGVAGNVFNGPTAFQTGDNNRMDNHFGTGS